MLRPTGEILRPTSPPEAVASVVSHAMLQALTMLLYGKPLLERLRRIQIKYGMMEP